MVARICSEPGSDSPVRPSRWSPGSARSRGVTHLSVPLDGRPDLLGAGGDGEQRLCLDAAATRLTRDTRCPTHVLVAAVCTAANQTCQSHAAVNQTCQSHASVNQTCQSQADANQTCQSHACVNQTIANQTYQSHAAANQTCQSQAAVN